MKIIDAKDLIVGRLATYTAKQALLGEEIAIVNCKEAIITGKSKKTISKTKDKREMGDTFSGPFYPKRSDRIMKRIIRGMLPYKKTRGREALKRIKCYVGVPEELKDKEIEKLDSANIKNSKTLKYTTLGRISRSMGVNHE